MCVLAFPGARSGRPRKARGQGSGAGAVTRAKRCVSAQARRGAGRRVSGAHPAPQECVPRAYRQHYQPQSADIGGAGSAGTLPEPGAARRRASYTKDAEGGWRYVLGDDIDTPLIVLFFTVASPGRVRRGPGEQGREQRVAIAWRGEFVALQRNGTGRRPVFPRYDHKGRLENVACRAFWRAVPPGARTIRPGIPVRPGSGWIRQMGPGRCGVVRDCREIRLPGNPRSGCIADHVAECASRSHEHVECGREDGTERRIGNSHSGIFALSNLEQGWPINSHRSLRTSRTAWP
jgi:hypothetical protein